MAEIGDNVFTHFIGAVIGGVKGAMLFNPRLKFALDEAPNKQIIMDEMIEAVRGAVTDFFTIAELGLKQEIIWQAACAARRAMEEGPTRN